MRQRELISQLITHLHKTVDTVAKHDQKIELLTEQMTNLHSNMELLMVSHQNSAITSPYRAPHDSEGEDDINHIQKNLDRFM
jgi:hypothetical protein